MLREMFLRLLLRLQRRPPLRYAVLVERNGKTSLWAGPGITYDRDWTTDPLKARSWSTRAAAQSVKETLRDFGLRAEMSVFHVGPQ